MLEKIRTKNLDNLEELIAEFMRDQGGNSQDVNNEYARFNCYGGGVSGDCHASFKKSVKEAFTGQFDLNN